MSEMVRMAAGGAEIRFLVQRTARASALQQQGAEVIAAEGE
jgi:hypothetical protein